MKIHALTQQGQTLVTALNKAIRDGDLRTWKTVKNAQDEILYSHTPDQWDEKVLLKPSVENDKVSFTVKWWDKAEAPNNETRGYVLGRFVEVLLVHFAQYYNSLQIHK